MNQHKEPFFFSQDGDGHWFMIPSRLREQWWAALELDLDTDEGYDKWLEYGFEDYSVGGGISDIDVVRVNVQNGIIIEH